MHYAVNIHRYVDFCSVCFISNSRSKHDIEITASTIEAKERGKSFELKISDAWRKVPCTLCAFSLFCSWDIQTLNVWLEACVIDGSATIKLCSTKKYTFCWRMVLLTVFENIFFFYFHRDIHHFLYSILVSCTLPELRAYILSRNEFEKKHFVIVNLDSNELTVENHAHTQTQTLTNIICWTLIACAHWIVLFFLF